MPKWENRVKQILKNEREKHKAVYQLSKQLYELAHGFTPVDKVLLLQEIRKLCDSATLIDSRITNVSTKPRYERSSKECDQVITISIEGDFNGYIKIETGGGYRNSNEGRIDIFYVYSSDNEIVSFKGQKLLELYKQYKHTTVEKLIDLALDNKYYLQYEDCYKNYEIWHKEPSQYGDSIKGELNVRNKEYSHYYKKKHHNLNKLIKCDNLLKFAEEYLDGSSESTTYEWFEYRL
ncbi:hypothetical protein [Cytobacillus praedii]|uniref:Uncharacterized protein n=1 Tax=Cytobacillus praedii TaxID=1742358 RepID=A0A4R1AKF7_9BACI|nr:hypothetical protein [Cytobacillus praedii]TCI99993.1 hypothetical protein E0Y62_27035 [Cytobacillus praedii]